MSYQELYFLGDPLITSIIPNIDPRLKVFGVPFDSTSTYRPGSRLGPNAIREAYLNIELYSQRLGVDLEAASIEDLGNLTRTSDVDKMVSSVSKICEELLSQGYIFAALGGEHTISYGTIRAVPQTASIVIFDAHLDSRNEFEELKLSHATFLRRLLESRSAENIIHIGARAASAKEWIYANQAGLTTISTHTAMTVEKPEKLLRDFLSTSSTIYVSLDMDVLDPAYAPAVGNPETAGLTTHQILEFIYSLEGKKLIGFDIVELSPLYDNGTTAIAAAKFLVELACLALKS